MWMSEPVLNPSPRASASNDYAGFGLTIRSELTLPELGRIDAVQGEPDVLVRLSALAGEDWDRIVGIESGLFRLRVAGIGKFEATEGRTVTIDPEPTAAPAELRAYLLGTVFGALFQQRGLLALHASAVATGEDEAIAFLGESGAGKSTLAMAMNARGHELLSDDVSVIARAADGSPATWPGVRRLKLWSQSIEAGGGTTAGLEPVLQRENKFHVPSSHVAPYRPYRLSRIYLLGARNGETAGIKRLRGAEAVQALVSHTFRGRMVPFMDASERHFRACLSLLENCPVYRLDRAWGLDHIDRSCDAIAQHLRQESF